MTDPKTVLDADQIQAAQLDGWQVEDSTLVAQFDTGDFVTGLQLVNRVGEAAESANHHPDVELTYPVVTVRLTSHDVGGITTRDTELATQINGFAHDLGVVR